MEALSPFGYLIVMIAMQFSPVQYIDGNFEQVFSNSENTIKVTMIPGQYADYWDLIAEETPKNGVKTQYKASGYVKDGTIQMYSLKRTQRNREETLFAANSSSSPLVFISNGNPWDWFYLNVDGDMIYFNNVVEKPIKRGHQMIGTYKTQNGFYISITMRLNKDGKRYFLHAISFGTGDAEVIDTYVLE